MSRFKAASLALAAVAAFAVAGCPRIEPQPATTDFTGFVSDLIQNQTSDTADPVDIADTSFDITEDDAAFDDVLSGDVQMD